MMKKVNTTETWHRFRNMFIFDLVTSILHPLQSVLRPYREVYPKRIRLDRSRAKC